MGREIRRVPANWEHPIDEKGHDRPMHDRTYITAIISHFQYEFVWYIKHPKEFLDFFKGWPTPVYYRRLWLRRPTHYQIYETVSEGSPVSPVFATLDELAAWLIDQGYSPEATKIFAETGWAPSMVMSRGEIRMDIESLTL